MELDKTTLDILLVLVPAFTTVLAALIPAIVELITKSWQTSEPDSAPTTSPHYPATPQANISALGRIWAFFRSARFISGFVGLMIGLSLVIFPRFIARDLPTFDVQKLHIGFSQPGDAPSSETQIAVPPIVHTRGTTEHIVDKERSMWVIVCNRVLDEETTCFIQRLNLDVSGRWDEFVEIGTAEQNCTIFTVGFITVDKQINDVLEISGPNLLYNSLPHDQFLVRKWFVTRRELNEFEDVILCSAQSTDRT